MKELEGFRVAILATDGFEESELVEPRRALDAVGAETTVLAPGSGEIQGMHHAEKGSRVPIDRPLGEAPPDEFDAVLLPGGVANADKLRMNENARDFVRSMDRMGRPIAVICHGPWLLVSAGLVKGRRLASYYTVQDDIRNAGGRWSDEEVVRDRNWISSRQPDDIPVFNKAMIQLFAETARSRPASSEGTSRQRKGATSGR